MCVNDEDARVILIVAADPIVAAFMLTVDFRGTVVSAMSLEVVTLKPFAPVPLTE